MSSGLMKFIGALLLIGAIGYVGVQALFTKDVRGFGSGKPVAKKSVKTQ